ncbi:antirestriction protein, partial [Escherichia coli]|uniref:antirestriction protein n=1 Tax=Escherichia coli TaxID=562 RepID=UPI0011E8C3F3
VNKPLPRLRHIWFDKAQFRTYSHHACRTECYAMTVHYYRLRDYALQHPECSAIMRIID